MDVFVRRCSSLFCCLRCLFKTFKSQSPFLYSYTFSCLLIYLFHAHYLPCSYSSLILFHLNLLLLLFFFPPPRPLTSHLVSCSMLFYFSPPFIICLISSFFRLQSAYSYGSCPLFLHLLDFFPSLPPPSATFSLIIFPTTCSPSSSPSFSVLLVSSWLVRMCRSTSFLLRVRRCRSV